MLSIYNKDFTMTIKDIVTGLSTKSIKKYNTDLFSGDKDSIELGDIKGMTNLIIDESDTNAYTRVARILSTQDDVTYLTLITQSIYAGEKQISATIQPLTTQGICYYFSKAKTDDVDITIFDETFERILKDDYNISATMEDLRAIAVLNTEFDVFMIEFETLKSKYWITLSQEGLLKKVTVRDSEKTAKASFVDTSSLL